MVLEYTKAIFSVFFGNTKEVKVEITLGALILSGVG